MAMASMWQQSHRTIWPHNHHRGGQGRIQGGLRVLKYPPKLPKVLVDSTAALSPCRMDRRAYIHCYFACAALCANVASQIGSQSAESAFLGLNAMMMNDLGLQRRGRHAFPASTSKLGGRINAKRGYSNAKAAVSIPTLSNRGYEMGYCTAPSSSCSPREIILV